MSIKVKRSLTDTLNIDYFVHPIPLAAVALMAVNDHYLKFVYPGLITHKLSDFLGLFFFPLLLCAITTLIRNHILIPKPEVPWSIGKTQLILCMIVSTGVFIAVKTHDGFRESVTAIFVWLGNPILIAQTKLISSLFLAIFPVIFLVGNFLEISS